MSAKDNLTAHGSSDYDAQIRKTIPWYDTFHDQTIAVVAETVPAPDLWIDTGGGTGTLIEKAHGRFPSTRFILADPSAGMLGVARSRLRGKDRVTILDPVDSTALDLAEPADVITAIQSHHYLHEPEREAATRNCCRLLKAGGLYVTFENIRPLTDRGTEIGNAEWGRFQVGQGRDPDAVRAHLARFGVEYFPLTVEQHLALLRRCGFRVVEILWYSVMQAGFYCIR